LHCTGRSDHRRLQLCRTSCWARRAPMSSSVLSPDADSAARPGSCRKPPRLLYVKSGKERDLLAFAFVVRWELTTFLRRRRRATYGGTCRWPRRMSHRPTDAAAEREVLSPLPARPERRRARRHFSRRSSRHASAGRSSPNGRPPSFTAAVAQIGRHPSEWPHATPARVAQIVARLSRRPDQILVPCAAHTGQRRRPATPLEREDSCPPSTNSQC
jgi:hypothetical protein